MNSEWAEFYDDEIWQRFVVRDFRWRTQFTFRFLQVRSEFNSDRIIKIGLRLPVIVKYKIGMIFDPRCTIHRRCSA